MQRALVIRTYGDLNLAKPIASSLENQELLRLQAKLGVKSYREKKDYQRKIQEIPKKYPIRKISPAAQKFWALYGFICVLLQS